MVWVPPPSGKRGRQHSFSDAAIQTCLTIKVLLDLPLRQTTGFVESLLQLAGLDWAVPDFSTLCRRQRTLNVDLSYRGSTGPLNLLVDREVVLDIRPVCSLVKVDQGFIQAASLTGSVLLS